MGTGNVVNLKGVYLFESLGQSHINRLQEISSAKKYKKGQLLFLEGETPQNLHILVEGVLKVYKSDPRGNEIVLNHFHPVALIAELANLEHIPYPASSVFETDGKVLTINYKLFEDEFLKNPDISFSIIKSLTKKLMALNTVISHNLTMTSAGKVARFIYDNEKLFLQLKQRKIASILNITPETMSRVMRRLRECMAIDKSSGGFRVMDREKLKEFFL
jgi:CRP/FNR family transcriptional regulator